MSDDLLPMNVTYAAPSLVPATRPGELLAAIVQLARDKDVDVTKLEAFMHMQERLEARQAERAFIAAFSRLSAKLPRIAKNGTITLITKEGVNKGSIPFARYEDMDKVLRPLMAE